MAAIILRPAFADSFVIVSRDTDMHEIDLCTARRATEG